MSESSVYYNPRIVSQLAAVGIRVRRGMEGPLSGQHRSPLHGESPEFAEYRSYTPGDDLRNLDWRVYARSNRYFVKRHEEESNLQAHIVLDTSSSMGYQRQHQSKFDMAATLAVSMAATLVRQRDAVGLVTFDTAGEFRLRLSSSDAQVRKLCTTLENVEPNGKTDLAACLLALADRIPRRGLVVVISDFLTDLESLFSAIRKLQFSGHELLAFHVLDRDEVDLPFRGPTLFQDLENQRELFADPQGFRIAYRDAMLAFMNSVRDRLHSLSVDYLSIFTDDDLGNQVSHFLRRRQR